jgi:hypothetical protein
VNASQVEIREARSAADEDAAAQLMAAYLTWGSEQLNEHYGVSEAPASPSEVRQKLDVYRPPAGRLLLAYRGDRAVGVGALRRLSDGAARLIDSALEDGAKVIRLDTARFMTAAHGLYRSRGFIERPPMTKARFLPTCTGIGSSSNGASQMSLRMPTALDNVSVQPRAARGSALARLVDG